MAAAAAVECSLSTGSVDSGRVDDYKFRGYFRHFASRKKINLMILANTRR
jgi:hypothetical protein